MTTLEVLVTFGAGVVIAAVCAVWVAVKDAGARRR
jgi:hypothetical protein